MAAVVDLDEVSLLVPEAFKEQVLEVLAPRSQYAFVRVDLLVLHQEHDIAHRRVVDQGL